MLDAEGGLKVKYWYEGLNDGATELGYVNLMSNFDFSKCENGFWRIDVHRGGNRQQKRARNARAGSNELTIYVHTDLKKALRRPTLWPHFWSQERKICLLFSYIYIKKN